MLENTKKIATLALSLLVCGSCGTSQKKEGTESRALPGGRELVISVPQAEIEADIDQSHLVGPGFFSVVAILAEKGIESIRNSSAQADIQPVRAALQGYSFDKVAQTAVVGALSQVQALGVSAGQSTFSKDISVTSPERIDTRLRSAKTQEVIFMTLNYALTHRFRGVRVSWGVIIRAKDTQGTGKAWFTQMVSCIVPLPKSSPDLEINRPIWTANSGKAVKDGIDVCLGKLNYLINLDLQMSADARAKLKRGTLIDDRINRVKGSIIESKPDSTLVLGKLDTEFDHWILLMKPAAEAGSRSR